MRYDTVQMADTALYPTMPAGDEPHTPGASDSDQKISSADHWLVETDRCRTEFL